MQACRLKPEIGEAHGLLSWGRPGFRQRRIFAAIQPAVDAGLLAAGVTAIRSWVVGGPGAGAMAAAIIARSGAKVAETCVAAASAGSVISHEWLRQLAEPEVRPCASAKATTTPVGQNGGWAQLRRKL